MGVLQSSFVPDPAIGREVPTEGRVTVHKEEPVCHHPLRQGKWVLTLLQRLVTALSTAFHSASTAPHGQGIWDLARVVLNVLGGVSLLQLKAVVVKV